MSGIRIVWGGGVGQRSGVERQLSVQKQRGLREVHPLVVVERVVREDGRRDRKRQESGDERDQRRRDGEPVDASSALANAACDPVRRDTVEAKQHGRGELFDRLEVGAGLAHEVDRRF